MHPSLDPRLLLRWELEERDQSGYDTSAVRARLDAAGGLASAPSALVDEAHEAVAALPRGDDWSRNEPEDLAAVRRAADWPSAPQPVAIDSAYRAEVLRAWSGRVAGNMLGKPVEGLGRDAIRSLLLAHDAWPLSDYFPPPAPGTAEVDTYVACWPETTLGNIDGSSRDDDVDYTIVNLHVLERHGSRFDTASIATAWLELLPYLQIYTAERVAVRNLLRGDEPEAAAVFRNPYREFIGAAIRADVFGYVNPGDPGAAAEMAHRDAVLSHRANGVYSEMWCAALVAAAFTAESATDALRHSLAVVPRRSRLFGAVSDVLESHQRGNTWEATLDQIYETWHDHNWVHALNNAAVVAAGIAYGDGDFARTIGLTVASGLDTDSNGATAGSVAGLLCEEIPARWLEPLKDTVRSAVFGYDGISLTSLADRTAEVAAGLRREADRGSVSDDGPPASPAAW